MKTFRIAALALGTILALQANAATGRYDLKDVGAGVPIALNASGQVVVFGGGAAAYVVTGAQGVGSFSPCPSSATRCTVAGIDDAGDVALMYGSTVPPTSSAIVHYDGTNLRKVVDPDGTPTLTGLSHAGKMTGNDLQTVFRGQTSKKRVNDLALPAGYLNATAAAINDGGQIVGAIQGEAGGTHIMLALPGSPMQDLGGLPAGNNEFSTGTAISKNGYVVGYANVTTNEAVHAPLGIYFHAVLARVGTPGLTDLGTLDGNGYGFSSYAKAVNKAGTVVGASEKNEDFDTAFVLNVGDMVMTDLNTLVDLPAGLRLVGAMGINEAGQIIATGSDGHAWLLTPR